MIHLYTITFGRPDLILHQKRLLEKYLLDEHQLNVIDNTPSPGLYEMQALCGRNNIPYLHAPGEKHEHHEALNFAAGLAERMGHEYFGFLDHDVFPRKETSLIEKLKSTGFYGIGQTHPPTRYQYLWPGFCFFSKKWLNGRKLDFGGIRGEKKRDDGDTGSSNWPLFAGEDWDKLWNMEHGYKPVREPDGDGIQSWAIEILGDFIHFTNASHWKEVRDPQGRDRVLNEILESM